MFDPKIKILVADDMMTMRLVITQFLSDLGYKDVTEATNGEHAWTLIKASPAPFDLILSDWNMPKMTGVELVQKVRQEPALAKTPFVLITTESETPRVLEAVKAGVSDYIVKPFTIDTIREKLKIVYGKTAK